MKLDAKIYVAGHKGLVGSALVRQLKKLGYHNLLTRTHAELDLTNQAAALDFFMQEKPEYVFLAAARVGGIHANNTYRAEFIYQNLMIQLNTIHAAWLSKVKRLLFLGSSCIYPRECPQPIKEEYLLSGYLEPTNEPYAIAKIAGIKLCENYNRQYGATFLSVMPTNLYGPNDNYDLANSHVLPALIRKAHEAKINNLPELVVWGSGKVRRELLYSEDMADACIFLMRHESDDIAGQLFNIGTGLDVTIQELVETTMEVVGFKGKIVYDTTKPDGTPRKVLNMDRMHNLGWKAKIDLKSGIALSYHDFLQQYATVEPTIS